MKRGFQIIKTDQSKQHGWTIYVSKMKWIGNQIFGLHITYILVVLYCVTLLSCEGSYKKDSCDEITTVWSFNDSSKVYYELYFDHRSVFIFSAKNSSAVLTIEDGSQLKHILVRLAKASGSKDSVNNMTRLIGEESFININPINVTPVGDFIYRISEDEATNSKLFEMEATKRMKKYYGIDYPVYGL